MHFSSERFTNPFFNAVILALPILVGGCSFSDSSRSISDSIESSSDSSGSISDSSESNKEKKYENEVSDYTMAYVKSSKEADYAAYQKGLSDIAAKRGIVNWDQEPKTYIAIGKGLKKAGIEGVAYETYKRNFAGSDEAKMQNIQKGYESEK
ncbi:putative lipoprotein [Methylosarcina fibrata]|uniref:putative lipoprotein n=1 Tax=Methylosarcina fibrata TaxID=105972 RepID=UPI00036B7BD9|nr:putative lipoprotein [Methylosarcina fibrata]